MYLQIRHLSVFIADYIATDKNKMTMRRYQVSTTPSIPTIA
jgi:hypothetical protein